MAEVLGIDLSPTQTNWYVLKPQVRRHVHKTDICQGPHKCEIRSR